MQDSPFLRDGIASKPRAKTLHVKLQFATEFAQFSYLLAGVGRLHQLAAQPADFIFHPTKHG